MIQTSGNCRAPLLDSSEDADSFDCFWCNCSCLAALYRYIRSRTIAEQPSEEHQNSNCDARDVVFTPVSPTGAEVLRHSLTTCDDEEKQCTSHTQTTLSSPAGSRLTTIQERPAKALQKPLEKPLSKKTELITHTYTKEEKIQNKVETTFSLQDTQANNKNHVKEPTEPISTPDTDVQNHFFKNVESKGEDNDVIEAIQSDDNVDDSTVKTETTTTSRQNKRRRKKRR